MSVAKSHNEFGPIILNWEGGYAGERKIQEVKPLLGIKRINADWEKITMRKYYQSKTINKIMEYTQQQILPQSKKSRETEGLLKIYSNKKTAEAAVTNCEPLSAVLDHNNRLYIGYRPIQKKTRSSLALYEVKFNDTNGMDICNICWMAPIFMGDEILPMKSLKSVLLFAKEFCLLLPLLDDAGLCYTNMYYAIGNKWTERKSNGRFEVSTLNTKDIFNDWKEETSQILESTTLDL